MDIMGKFVNGVSKVCIIPEDKDGLHRSRRVGKYTMIAGLTGATSSLALDHSGFIAGLVLSYTVTHWGLMKHYISDAKLYYKYGERGFWR